MEESACGVDKSKHSGCKVTFATELSSDIPFFACNGGFALQHYGVHRSDHVGDGAALPRGYSGKTVCEALKSFVRCWEIDVVAQTKVDGVDHRVFFCVQRCVRNVKRVGDVPRRSAG